MGKYPVGILLIFLIMVSNQFAAVRYCHSSKISINKIKRFSERLRDDDDKIAVAETKQIIDKVVAASYPELQRAQISVKTFHSSSDYFRSQFSISRFLTFRRLSYVILVNPKIFKLNAPIEGIRAILSHELAHAAYYASRNRVELLGLTRLMTKSFTVRFERSADLQAIKRGYGSGLSVYRDWLYRNISAANIAEKKRDYFSPEEIEMMLKSISQKPELIDFWLKNMPRNLAEIEKAVNEQIPNGK